MNKGLMESNRVLAGAFGLLLALALIVGLTLPAFGQPPQWPHKFWGDVTIDGGPAAEGTRISAQIDEVEVAFCLVDDLSRYGYGTDPLLVEGQPGDIIRFYISTTLATTLIDGIIVDDVAWESGGRTEMELALGAAAQHVLTIDSTDCGNVTDPGEGDFPYLQGAVVGLFADPDEGCCFDQWTGNVTTVADVNAANTTITMNDDYAITANFVAKVTLTTASDENGTVTVPGEGDFDYCPGEIVPLLAVGNLGYALDEWTGEVGTVADVNAANTTITMDASYAITATFIFVGTSDLTVQSTAGGNVTDPVEGTHTYTTGAVVDLLAEADPGFCFDQWTGDVDTVADVNDASTTIIVDADYTVTANFIAEVILTTSSTVGGTVTLPGEGDFPYCPGTLVALLAEADTGYQFDQWTGEVATVDDVNAASTTITMDDDYAIQATFELAPTPTPTPTPTATTPYVPGPGPGPVLPTPTPTAAAPTPTPAVTTPTPTPTATVPPIPTEETVALPVDDEGVVQEDVEESVFFGMVDISIGDGTIALTEDGEPLQEITVEEICFGFPAPPAGAYVVGCVYDFLPDGATFDPPITITLHYDPGQVAALGLAEENLKIALYNAATGEWQVLDSIVDTENNIITAEVSEFTMFAVYSPAPAATPTPTPVPVTPTPTAAPGEEGGANVGAIVGGIIGGLIVIALIVYFIMRRRGGEAGPPEEPPKA